MGAIKNYLINHPEIMDMRHFDEGYRLRMFEQEAEWQREEEELLLINTELQEESFNQKHNYATA